MSNSESFTLPDILKQHGNVFKYFLPECPVIIFGYATSLVSVPELAKIFQRQYQQTYIILMLLRIKSRVSY